MSRLTVLAVLAVLVVVMWAASFATKHLEHVASGVAVLDALRFERTTLFTLGTGGTFENPLRMGPAIAFGHGDALVLVDAGRGVAESLRRSEIPAWQPTRVLLTSLAPENTVGLDDLLATGWLGPREAPLEVWGPTGTMELVTHLAAAHAPGLESLGRAWSLPEAGGRITARDLAGGESFEVGEIRIRVASLGDEPSLAYRLEAGGRAVVVSGTSSAPGAEALVSLAEGATYLVVEAIYGASLDAAAEAGFEGAEVMASEATTHLRLEDVGALASRAGVGGVVLTRLRPPPVFDFQYQRVVGASFRGSIVVAEDGRTIELPLPRTD